MWLDSCRAERGRIGLLFAPHIAKITVFLTLMNACTLFGWWGLNSWVPAYLALDPTRGGIGTVLVDDVAVRDRDAGGHVVRLHQLRISCADAIGRKRTYVMFLLARGRAAAALRFPAQSADAAPARAVRRVLRHRLLQRLRRGRRGAVSDVGPRDRRRASATTPAASPARRRRSWSARSPARAGSASAFSVAGAAFLLAAVTWIWIPETRNRELT